MESNHLKTFEINGFKKFDNLVVDDLGQFNLIIGNNNVGKTSLLEALLVDIDYSNFIYSLGSIIFNVKHYGNLSSPFLNLYFTNTQSSFPKSINFKLKYVDGFHNLQFSAKNEHQFTLNINEDHIKDLNENSNLKNKSYLSPLYNVTIPFIPMGNFYSSELTTQFSKNIQDNVQTKEQFINTLEILIPNIKYIELSLKYSSSPTLVVTEFGKNDLIPLASYGEGVLKLFRIVLSIFSIKNFGRIMIDELDAGIHYSHLQSFISSLLKVSIAEKKQLFATTHSKECIENFTKALEETGMQSEGRIIRIAETKAGIKAFTMRFEEFENALLAESEIR